MVKSELTGETQRPKFSKPVKVLVVVASYYKEISDDLISGATEELKACGADFDVITVPGALELPNAIGMASRLCEYDAYVALGCVVRGETTHYDTVCNDCRWVVDAGWITSDLLSPKLATWLKISKLSTNLTQD